MTHRVIRKNPARDPLFDCEQQKKSPLRWALVDKVQY
jgi:hypothetical protein